MNGTNAWGLVLRAFSVPLFHCLQSLWKKRVGGNLVLGYHLGGSLLGYP